MWPYAGYRSTVMFGIIRRTPCTCYRREFGDLYYFRSSGSAIPRTLVGAPESFKTTSGVRQVSKTLKLTLSRRNTSGAHVPWEELCILDKQVNGEGAQYMANTVDVTTD